VVMGPDRARYARLSGTTAEFFGGNDYFAA
jgi:hypothetical protein